MFTEVPMKRGVVCRTKIAICTLHPASYACEILFLSASVIDGKGGLFVSKKIKAFGSVKRLCAAAMLVAISVVIGIFCKNLLNFGNGLFRITFEGMPIILSGIMFGPVVGGIVGLCSDVLSYFLSTQTFAISPIVTAAAMLMGVISGVVAKYIVKTGGNKQIIVAGALSHIICSMIIKTAGLFIYYQWAVLLRIPLYCIIAPIEILIICLMYKNREIRKIITEIQSNKRSW